MKRRLKMTMMHDPALARTALRAAQRTHFGLFLMAAYGVLHAGEPPLQLAWYLQAMCHELNCVFAGKNRRLLINIPPRHLKTITVSVAWVAWLLGQNPRAKIMVASYSEGLSRGHAEQCRALMSSPWYRKLFPETHLKARAQLLNLQTTTGGFRKAVSVGGTVTGHGADIIIIDDCMKAEDATSPARRDELHSWYNNTLGTRLNDKRSGAIVSIQQRLHEDDLPAKLLDYGFHHLKLRAIADKDERIAIGPGRYHLHKAGDLLDPVRHPDSVLDMQRDQLGPQGFSAQYLQEPVHPDGNLIQWAWFKDQYHEVGERDDYRYVVQSWDTASSLSISADWSVCLTFGYVEAKGDWELVDHWRGRLTMPSLRRKMIRMQERWSPEKILIEDKDSGRGIVQDLAEHYGSRARQLLVPITPVFNKETRVDLITPQLERQMVILPKTAPWLPEFKRELVAFPHGRHDDQVDALSQFLEWTKWRQAKSITNPPPPRRFPSTSKRGPTYYERNRYLW
jgi:predicted phage terminase large subunit-like protein